MTSNPHLDSVPDDLEQVYLGISLGFVITSAMSRQMKGEATVSDPFDLYIHSWQIWHLDLTGFGKTMTSHTQLVSEQKTHPTLCSLFKEAVEEK